MAVERQRVVRVVRKTAKELGSRVHTLSSEKNAELRSGTDADSCLFSGEETRAEISKPPR